MQAAELALFALKRYEYRKREDESEVKIKQAERAFTSEQRTSGGRINLCLSIDVLRAVLPDVPWKYVLPACKNRQYGNAGGNPLCRRICQPKSGGV